MNSKWTLEVVDFFLAQGSHLQKSKTKIINPMVIWRNVPINYSSHYNCMLRSYLNHRIA